MWLAACTGKEPLPAEMPVCDGLLQEGESTIDSPFDADNDGYFDLQDLGCASTYDPFVLDCDDAAYERHPGAPEYACNGIDDDCNIDTPDAEDRDGDLSIACDDCDDNDASRSPLFAEDCWDEVDNDCDGEVDPGCGFDYNGLFVLEVPVVYGCALQTPIGDFPLVNIDIQTVTMVFIPPNASMISNETTQPGTLDGEVQPDGSFVFETSVVLGTALSCDEYYRMTGSFTGPDRFDATFEAVFDGTCLSCQNQTVEGVVGLRAL